MSIAKQTWQNAIKKKKNIIECLRQKSTIYTRSWSECCTMGGAPLAPISEAVVDQESVSEPRYDNWKTNFTFLKRWKLVKRFCVHVGVFFCIRRNQTWRENALPKKKSACVQECSACDSTLVTEHTIQGSAWALPNFCEGKKRNPNPKSSWDLVEYGESLVNISFDIHAMGPMGFFSRWINEAIGQQLPAESRGCFFPMRGVFTAES